MSTLINIIVNKNQKREKKVTSCSEYVTLGHPDKTADAIASYLLDEYIKHDPKVRFALEVQLKDHTCNLAGEVTSTWKPSEYRIALLAREAIAKVGYTDEYAARWPEGATLNADKVTVNNYIGQQSPNIAQGVDRDGWGDQGVYMGMATNDPEFGYMPRDRYFAHEIGKRLYRAAKNNTVPIGLDIKTLVSMEFNHVEQVIVAVPMMPGVENEHFCYAFVQSVVREVLAEHGCACSDIIINGTGAYVIHSSVGDAGVVGRKLAVDFYGLNCPIGGGATFGKDGSKADVTLNLAARYFSLLPIVKNASDIKGKASLFTKIACSIGRSDCLITQTDLQGNLMLSEKFDIKPSELIEVFGLSGKVRDDMFFHLCEDGLFSYVDEVAKKRMPNT